MKNGLYRNDVGAELHVVGFFQGHGRVKQLGGIYVAEARDPLFGVTEYLVTDESFRHSAYELIEESK